MAVKTQYFNKNGEKMQKIKKSNNFFDVDFSFFLIFVFAFFTRQFWFYLVYVLFLILHELCHFFVAKKLGYYPKKIKLNFFGAALEGDDDFLILDEIKIVFAGPFFNFCVIVLCYLCFWFWPESYEFLYQILEANVAIFLFNMLPIFPLDFGRILLLLFSKKMTRNKAAFLVKKVSFCFAMVLFVLFLLSLFKLPIFGLGLASINLMILLFSSSDDTSYKRQIFARRKFEFLQKGLLERVIYLREGTSNFELFKFIDDSHFVRFVFLNEGLKKTSEISEIDFYKQNGLL